ncbi:MULTISPECIES: hypothetical protein [unclassified Oceanobacillus]|uniref:hypothetical protein n=1 Tax=unclassified Oceanobacillus TaxID=2630292 RepID=UPI001BE78983|nr:MULTISPECIES: hypothetical protein [unclassified Oceanobacillus]MBT2601437.1 hypothetical protein [Oceanobacillus sp. ISL-74]MBT2653286.1 hypothetical protein [Oceanobacillus sp. ISL-73]
MATKSFTSEFKFTQKNANGLMNAIENSKKVTHNVNKKVSVVSDKKNIDSIMSSFFGK